MKKLIWNSFLGESDDVLENVNSEMRVLLLEDYCVLRHCGREFVKYPFNYSSKSYLLSRMKLVVERSMMFIK